MKFTKIVSLFSLMIFFSSSLSAQSKYFENFNKEKLAKAEASYIAGLESKMVGIRVNCAFYLGEMQSIKSVNLLIDMLKNDRSYPAKIMAAISLFKIGHEKGIYEATKIREFIPEDTSSYENYIAHLTKLWNQYLNDHPDEAVALKGIPLSSQS